MLSATRPGDWERMRNTQGLDEFKQPARYGQVCPHVVTPGDVTALVLAPAVGQCIYAIDGNIPPVDTTFA